MGAGFLPIFLVSGQSSCQFFWILMWFGESKFLMLSKSLQIV
jgi:hypothetical protein